MLSKTDTSTIYKTIIEMEETSIPRKFRKKYTTRQGKTKKKSYTEPRKIAGPNWNTRRLNNTLYEKIHRYWQRFIEKSGNYIWETHEFLSRESKCIKKEQKYRNILERKATWLKTLPNKQKSDNEIQPRNTNQTHNKIQNSTQNNYIRHYQIERKQHNRGKKLNIRLVQK